MRWGSRGRFTNYADFGREMGLNRERTRAWEAEGRWPGRKKFADFLSRLERVRLEKADPMKLAEWAELGPDDAPPFDEPRGEMPGVGSPETPQVARPFPTSLRALLEAHKRGTITTDEAELAIPVVVKASLPGLDSNQEFEARPGSFRVLCGGARFRRLLLAHG